jgi:hypothetical protein
MSNAIPAVRILPMSDDEKSFRGQTIEDVQARFFLEDLPFPPRNGRFQYPSAGLNAPQGTVVLFQYGGRIIASAVFLKKVKYEQVMDGYKGAIWFDVNSIQIFDPINLDSIQSIWPNVIRLSQVKWPLDPAGYPAFERSLVRVIAPRRGKR